MAEFLPPIFTNLGKQFKDLIKKKYEFENSVKISNKTAFGLTLSTTGKIFKDKIAGSAKAVYVDKSWGEAEGEVDASSGKVWGKASFSKLVDNAKFILNGGFDPTSKDSLVKDGYSAKGEAEHRQDWHAVSGSLLVGDEGKGPAGLAEAAGVIGLEGFSVGLQAKAKLDQSAQSIADYNVGAQHEFQDFTGTLLTESQGEVIRFSVFHKVSKDYNWGFELISDENDHLAKSSDPRRRVLNIASEFQLDENILVKAKANHFGEISAVVEHRLSNPQMVVAAAAQFKAEGSSRLTPEKFGISVSFGD